MLRLCVARGIGLIVSSFIYTLLEQRVLFLVFAIFNVICAIIFALYFLITRKRSNGQTDLAKPPVDPGRSLVYCCTNEKLNAFHSRCQRQ